MAKPAIAIIGAGIGGLAAALALIRRGFPVRVFEQAAALTEVGAGVQISANGTKVLFDLGLKDRVMAAAVVPTDKRIRLWNTGDSWKGFDVGPVSESLYGAPYLTLHRHDLQAALADAVRALQPDALMLGIRLTGLVQDGTAVTLLFHDVREARAHIVIGADGVHSAVRHGLFGRDQPRFMGIVAWRGVIAAERLEPRLMAPVSTTWIGPGGHVVHYPLRRGELMNYVSVIERDDWQVESWSVQGTAQECLGDYAGWHEDVLTLIRAMDRPYKWALLGREPMPRWSRGAVTLLGDACHPMLPFMAQGAVMALEDALVLARCLDRHPNDPYAAFAAYEAARVERTSRVVRAAAANGRRYHALQLGDAEAAGAYVAEQWDEKAVRDRFEWLFSYDAASVEI